MLTQAIIEIMLMLLVAAFLGYKIGSLVTSRKFRHTQSALAQKDREIQELQFDLNHCVQIRRRTQTSLNQLRKQLVAPEAPRTVVTDQGKVQRAEAENRIQKTVPDHWAAVPHRSRKPENE